MHTFKSRQKKGQSKYLLLLSVFCAVWAYAQGDECLNRSSVVTVIGRRGNEAKDVKGAVSPILLTPADLRVKVGSKDVPIESVIRPSTPLRIVVVLDVGASQVKSTWDATRFIVHNFSSQFPEGTEFALVTFDSKAEQKSSLSSGSVLDQALMTVSPSRIKESKSGLYEALTAGIQVFGTNHPGDAEFLVTAWEDGGDSETSRAVAQDLSRAGVRLFGISFDSSRLQGWPAGAFIMLNPLTAIETVARTSGGLWTRTPGLGPGTSLLPKMFAGAMSNFYNVTLKLAQPVTKAQELQIKLVKDNLKSAAQNTVLSYPQTLYPCH